MTLETAVNYYAFLLREARKALQSADRRKYAIDCVSNFRLNPQIADQVSQLTIHKKGSLSGRIASDVLFMCVVLERDSLVSK